MTQENGTNQENHAVQSTYLPQNMEVIQKGRELQLKVDFTIDTERKIRGCAHFPAIDKERELILSDAISKALPDFMKHPILHYRHTERPVGTVTKAYIDSDGAFHIEGSIYDTPDTNDVWEQVKKGELNKFSIYGKRIDASPECSIPPGQRISPCVTKALSLFSISLVGDNAINPNTYLEVAKGGDSTPFGEYEDFSDCVSQNQSKDNPEGYCAEVHKKITGEYPAEKAEEEEKEDEKEEVEKSDVPMMPEGGLYKAETNVSSILERLGKVEEALNKLIESDKNVHESMGKSEDKMEVEENKEESVEKCSDGKPIVKKAETVEETPVTEYITKADLTGFITKAELDTFQKAFDELKSRVDKMEQETIEKGGNIVMIVNGQKQANPNVDNIDAIGSVL